MIDRLEEEDDLQFGGDHNLLTEELHIEDNYAMFSKEGNDEGFPYYMLQCRRHKFVIREGFDHVWGNSFSFGDSAVEGIYYQRWWKDECNYILLSNFHPAYSNLHSIKANYFPMVSNNCRVQGSNPM
jgi:hypothetical protein